MRKLLKELKNINPILEPNEIIYAPKIERIELIYDSLKVYVYSADFIVYTYDDNSSIHIPIFSNDNMDMYNLIQTIHKNIYDIHKIVRKYL